MDSIIGDDIVSSVRGTVQHIVQLAADPDAQEALMSMDGFLDNLIKYMNYDDEYIRLAAARAVEFLSNNTKVKEELAGNMEIRTIMTSMYWSDNEKEKKIAEGYFMNVRKYLSRSLNPAMSNPLCEYDMYNAKRTENIEYSFDMIGLEESEVRDELQRKIIGIAGVKSITFNKKSGQVIVDCCEVKGESLKPVITKSIESLIQSPVEVKETVSNKEPGFVDEIMDCTETGDEALTNYGFSSIESRLEEKRIELEEREKAKKRKNWLINTVSRVLSKWW